MVCSTSCHCPPNAQIMLTIKKRTYHLTLRGGNPSLLMMPEAVHPIDTYYICRITGVNDDPSNNVGDISFWTKVQDQITHL